MPIDFVLFDLGGVLLDVDVGRAEQRWRQRGYPGERFEDAFYASGAKPRGDVGEADLAQMAQLVEQTIEAPFGVDELVDIWGAGVRWHPWVEAFLTRLEVPYGVLSNIDPAHEAAVGRLPGAQPIVYSYDIGVMKPRPEAYERAIAQLPVSPDRVRYVDDLEENVTAARRSGLAAVRVDSLELLTRALDGLLSRGRKSPF